MDFTDYNSIAGTVYGDDGDADSITAGFLLQQPPASVSTSAPQPNFNFLTGFSDELVMFPDVQTQQQQQPKVSAPAPAKVVVAPAPPLSVLSSSSGVTSPNIVAPSPPAAVNASLQDIANQLAQSIIANHAQQRPVDAIQSFNKAPVQRLPVPAAEQCFSTERKVNVDALLEQLGFPQYLSSNYSCSDTASSGAKRKRNEHYVSSSSDDGSIDGQPAQKKHESSSSSAVVVVKNQMNEIRNLLHLNSNKSAQDDTFVLNLVIKMLKEDSLSKRSLNVAQNAPTIWPGYNYSGDTLEKAYTSTSKAVGVSKEQFQDSADYQTVFENSPFAQAICALDGRFVDCNSKFEEMTGYQKSQVAQTTLFATMDAKEVPQFLACVESLISGKMKIYMKQRKCVHANGDVYMAQCFISVVRDAETGKPLYFNCLGLPMFDQH
jgi:PAS domain S-box-containing protein